MNLRKVTTNFYVWNVLKVKVKIVFAYLQGYASQFLHRVMLSADALSAISLEGWPWSCKAEEQLREIQVM